jgi:hypothetical protein
MEYKRKSKEHADKLKKSPPANETEADKNTRLLEQAAEEAHLESLLRRADTLQSLEMQLETYRLEHWGKTRAMMRKELDGESHSPAGDVLGKKLLANKEPKPSSKYDAHHIIPGTGSHPLMGRIRAKLFSNGIRINDPLNGVWLAHLKEDRGHHLSEKAHVHPDTYGWNYQQWIGIKLKGLKDRPSNESLPPWIQSNFSPFLKELANIKRRLKEGTCPVKIMECKDPEWGGK